MFYKLPKWYRAPHARKLIKGKSKEEDHPVLVNSKNDKGVRRIYFPKPKNRGKKKMICDVDSFTEPSLFLLLGHCLTI